MSSLPPETLPQAVNLVHARMVELPRGDPAERERLARLRALATPAEWRAAVLALMTQPDNTVDAHAWRALVTLPDAAQLAHDIAQLLPAQRLPWFEHCARLLATEPVAARQELMLSARGLLTADGLVTPMDQLRWIALRHLLAGSASAPPGPAEHGFETLEYTQVHSICVWSGFLSTLVPTPEVHVDPTGYGSVSLDWYHRVTEPWGERADVPARVGHDIDAALRALRELQAMPWLLRPVLARSWFDAARALTDGPVLHTGAADALRLTCVLFDCPVPPALAQQYVEVEPTRH